MSSRYPIMDRSCDDLGDAISLLKKIILYFEDENIDSDKAKARNICRDIGYEGLRRLNVYKRYKQRQDVALDQFIIRARTLGLKCDFSDTQLSEQFLEVIISSMPHEELCRDLLSRPKGYSIADILKEGRKYEGLSAGNQKLQQMASGIPEVHGIARATNQQGKRCGTRYKPRQCPAYEDECHTCGARGHWTKLCKTNNPVRKRRATATASQIYTQQRQSIPRSSLQV